MADFAVKISPQAANTINLAKFRDRPLPSMTGPP
jgi:hypothetical protein